MRRALISLGLSVWAVVGSAQQSPAPSQARFSQQVTSTSPVSPSAAQPAEKDFFPDVEKLTGTKAKQAEDATTDFKGAGFGAGLAVVLDFGNKKRVSDAEVIGGIVRVKKEQEATPRVILNMHYFFSAACDDQKVGKWCKAAVITEGNTTRAELIPMRGWGPFVAVQPGSANTIDAAGGGILFGWRRQPDKPDSFNVGFGLLVDQNVKVLGDGFKENAAPPAGETQVRFKETSRWGLLLMASWAF